MERYTEDAGTSRHRIGKDPSRSRREKRVDEIQIQMAQIKAGKVEAKIEPDKELTLKELKSILMLLLIHLLLIEKLMSEVASFRG